GSALVLACYASPTVCDAIKHYRISANSMLGMELDSCRSLEQSLAGVQRQSQARAIKECLDEKARQGVPLDEAQKACRKSPELRRTAVRSVAAAQALADLVAEAQSAERTLESAELLATPEVRGELERRRAQLRNEISRLSETFEAERRVNAAIGEAQAAAAA